MSPAEVGSKQRAGAGGALSSWLTRRYQLLILVFSGFTFLTGVISPPYLVDDVDAVQASIARTMLTSGDFVTPHLNGIAYMEKAPLKYWLIALSFRIFGVHDWAAKLVIGLSAVLVCWLTARFAAWAISPLAGFYSGLVLSTCIGLFLFTRVLIPDPLLTLFILLAMWSFARALDEDESRWRWWARSFWINMALGVLTKGLIAAVFPIGTVTIYSLLTRQFFRARTWQRLLPVQGTLLFLLVAAPWHILATIANPPYFDLTMHSEKGAYHGFFWFYFLNEHIFRFLNLRYPHDYNTVPRHLFWGLHLVWFFPWSVYLWKVRALRFREKNRGSRALLLAACWAGFVMVFFTLSTTQEYYSLSAYPAFALLLGAGIAVPGAKLERGARIAASIAGIAAIVIAFLLWNVRNLEAPGDIARALSSNPELYTLSLGHMADLTFQAFAYLKPPLAIALIALLIGAVSGWLLKGTRAVLALALMMVIFFQAARVALQIFDPYLGSKGLADALLRSPEGKLIVDDQYYAFSSVFFYANKTALLLNGRVNNLEYGSYAPGAPSVFIEDADVPRYWASSDRWYLVADGHQIPRFEKLLGAGTLHQVAEFGSKYLFVNHK
jgi:4-amino-4-deoxy-L-arabinose transferase-like glycosyltransferase